MSKLKDNIDLFKLNKIQLIHKINSLELRVEELEDTIKDELYKTYTLQKNSFCSLPVPPKKEGAVFRHWRFVTGGVGVAQSLETAYANGRKTVLSSGGKPYLVSENTKLTAVFD